MTDLPLTAEGFARIGAFLSWEPRETALEINRLFDMDADAAYELCNTTLREWQERDIADEHLVAAYEQAEEEEHRV